MLLSLLLLITLSCPLQVVALPTLVVAHAPHDAAIAALARSLVDYEHDMGASVQQLDFSMMRKPPLPLKKLQILSLPSLKLILRDNATVLPVHIAPAQSVAQAVAHATSLPVSDVPVMQLHSCIEVSRVRSASGIDSVLVEFIDSPTGDTNGGWGASTPNQHFSSTLLAPPLRMQFNELAWSSGLDAHKTFARAAVTNVSECVQYLTSRSDPDDAMNSIALSQPEDAESDAVVAFTAGRAPFVFQKSQRRASELRAWARNAMSPLVPRVKRHELLKSTDLDELILFLSRTGPSSVDAALSESWLSALRSAPCTCVDTASDPSGLLRPQGGDEQGGRCKRSPPALRCMYVDVNGGDMHALTALGLQKHELPLAAVLNRFSRMAFPLENLQTLPTADEFASEVQAYFGELLRPVQRDVTRLFLSSEAQRQLGEVGSGLCMTGSYDATKLSNQMTHMRSHTHVASQVMHASSHDVATTLLNSRGSQRSRNSVVIALLCLRAAGVCQRAQVAFEMAGTEVAARMQELGKSQCERVLMPMLVQVECMLSHCGAPVLPINASVALPAVLAFRRRSDGDELSVVEHTGPLQSSHIAEFIRQYTLL